MENTATTTTKSSDPAIAPAADGADCERVNTVIEQLVEGHAVTAEDEDYLYDHATDCSPCFDSIEKQRVFVNFLNQRVARKPIPASLHDAILARIQG
ncbi:hypothetical protein Q5H93_11360 [Hymenobacter sp. ASUV-10]|uniref:Zinc-finger domain-containing protein n=1 Tax=Hymenobacter aranciens TaxID=3063996 RepID=A0ABT9BAN5_9BACT|nr:hypothetical protein [Hymenobacter sp. ASUV-10]MDO7875332.1 hypothetical protein [Hymenobacter sp. ASUV-10]